MRGFGRLLALYAIIQCHMHAGTLVVSGICQAKNRVLQSIIFSTAAFCSKWNRVSRSRLAVNGITLMDMPYLRIVQRPAILE